MTPTVQTSERTKFCVYRSVLVRGSLKRDLATYKTFGKNVEFKKYLYGVSDAGTRLLLNLGQECMVSMKS